jgi:hypothetical protein
VTVIISAAGRAAGVVAVVAVVVAVVDFEPLPLQAARRVEAAVAVRPRRARRRRASRRVMKPSAQSVAISVAM